MLSPAAGPTGISAKPTTRLETSVQTNGESPTVSAVPPAVVKEVKQVSENKEPDIDLLEAKFYQYRSNPPETEQYKAAVPFVLQLLKAKIEQKTVEKADYLIAAKTCLLVQGKHGLYLKLLDLWAKPTASEHLTEVKIMVNDNPIFEPRNPVIRPTPQSVTSLFGGEKANPFKNFQEIQKAVKNNVTVQHNDVIFAITELAVAGCPTVENMLCNYAVLGEEKKINAEVLENIEAAFKQDGKEIP